MNNILIIGGTGFLGRNLVKYIIKKNIFSNIVITGNSEIKLNFLKKKYSQIKLLKINVESRQDLDLLENLIIINKINFIINAAAMKYVQICQENIIKTLEINTIFAQNLVNICIRNNISNLISISTDKANNPKNVYGMSKYMMELITLNNGYKIYKGVNFLWSDGSVLDIWYKQMKSNEELTYADLNSIRYYNLIDEVCERIIDGFFENNNIIHNKIIYKISLEDLMTNFMKYFNYNKSKQIEFNEYEKDIEELDNNFMIKEITSDEIKNMIHFTYTITINN